MRKTQDRRTFCRLTIWSLVALGIVGRSKAKSPREDALTAPIQREPVQSKSIASIGYRADLRVLEIEFHSGAIYRYFAVSPEIFEEFHKAESKGHYFSQRIRDHFEFCRLPDAAR